MILVDADMTQFKYMDMTLETNKNFWHLESCGVIDISSTMHFTAEITIGSHKIIILSIWHTHLKDYVTNEMTL